MKNLIAHLDLVYPPISNFVADKLWHDSEVRKWVARSKMYMIGHRRELLFTNITSLTKDSCIYWLLGKNKFELFSLSLSLGDLESPKIDFTDFISKEYLANSIPIKVEAGERIIKFIDDKTNEILYWATPDKLLFDFSRRNIDVPFDKGFDWRAFSNFELYYVGISKERDSFSRLFDTAHEGRMKILTNETQKSSTARLTDELMIFLFDIRYFNFNVVRYDNFNEEIDHFDFYTDDDIAVIADAEKAFIKLMQTKYNVQTYSNYPKGTDGLYNKGLDSYIYQLNEDITFFADSTEFVGVFDDFNRDGICIKDSEVTIFKV